MDEELTGPRRSVMRGAWWMVFASGAWLFVAWPIDAYDVVFRCNPAHVEDVDAGNWGTLILSLLAMCVAYAALRGRGAATWHPAGWLLLAAPLAFAEWLFMSVELNHRCGEHVTASWIAEPTRDAVLAIVVAGPVLIALGAVLRMLERRRRPHLPTARAVDVRPQPSVPPSASRSEPAPAPTPTRHARAPSTPPGPP